MPEHCIKYVCQHHQKSAFIITSNSSANVYCLKVRQHLVRPEKSKNTTTHPCHQVSLCSFCQCWELRTCQFYGCATCWSAELGIHKLLSTSVALCALISNRDFFYGCARNFSNYVWNLTKRECASLNLGFCFGYVKAFSQNLQDISLQFPAEGVY